jgi:segregation and condensation protein B
MEDLKNKIEALLFSVGKATSIEEIKKICRVDNDEDINKALQDLKIDYDNRDSSLKLVNEADRWKIITKENYFNVVRKVVTETELSKSLMETLAVITWKYPIKQCDLIKIRTNKAYAHLDELENLGYISRQKHGRTKLIKLTDKFFSYFDLPPEKIKEKFSDFTQISQAITNKEKEIHDMKEAHKKQVEEIKKMQEDTETKQKQEIEKQKQEIDLIDKEGNKVELEQYESSAEQTKEYKDETKIEVFNSEVTENEEKEAEEPNEATVKENPKTEAEIKEDSEEKTEENELEEKDNTEEKEDTQNKEEIDEEASSEKE